VIDEAVGQSVLTGLRLIANDGVLVRHIRTESPSFAPGVDRAALRPSSVGRAARHDGARPARASRRRVKSVSQAPRNGSDRDLAR
jgi:hypothetical protein